MIFNFQNQEKSEHNLLNWAKAVIVKTAPKNGYSAVISLIKTKGSPAPSAITDIWKAFPCFHDYCILSFDLDNSKSLFSQAQFIISKKGISLPDFCHAMLLDISHNNKD